LFFVLQLIAYSNYYDTPIPGNAEIYVEEITKLVELSFINPDILIRSWINPEFNKELTVINKDAHISVWNDVKIYALMILVLAIVVAFMLVASLIKALRTSFQEGLSIMKTKFVWDYTIQFVYMAYLKLCMTVMNQMDLNSRNSYYWKQNDSDWAVVIGMLLIICPVLAGLFLYKSKTLNEVETKEKYQNLYQDAALYRNDFAKYYSIAFALRRIAYISIPMMFAEPMMQVIVFMFVHSLYLISYLAVKPHQDYKRTCVEAFNEMSLMVFMYHMAGWNGLIADPQASFDMGYSFIGVILVTLAINIGVIVYRTVENWRHKKAIANSRKLVLDQLNSMKETDSEKKAAKLLIRNEFIMKRMSEASPQDQDELNDANVVKVRKGKKLKSKKDNAVMPTIKEAAELECETIENRQANAMAAPDYDKEWNMNAENSLDHRSIEQLHK